MKYILTSITNIRGAVQEHFRHMVHVYYAEPLGNGQYRWTESMIDAKKFDSEDEAWTFARLVWGQNFCDNAFGVMGVSDRYIENMHLWEPTPGKMPKKWKNEAMASLLNRTS